MRTAVEWAHPIKDVVEERYPYAQRLTLVMDKLNTQVGTSLCQTFAPAEARRLLEQLESHYPPQPGSWLPLAELERSALTRQSLDRRTPDCATLTREVTAWETGGPASPAPVKWYFTPKDARVKLKRLYPSI